MRLLSTHYLSPLEVPPAVMLFGTSEEDVWAELHLTFGWPIELLALRGADEDRQRRLRRAARVLQDAQYHRRQPKVGAADFIARTMIGVTLGPPPGPDDALDAHERDRYRTVVVTHEDPAAAIEAALSDVARRTGIAVGFDPVRQGVLAGQWSMRFTTAAEAPFRFWKSQHGPDMPAGSPQALGWTCHSMVNGCTEAIIRSEGGLHRLLSPPESRTTSSTPGPGDSWKRLVRPDVAEGLSCVIDLDVRRIRDAGAVEALAGFLVAALNREDRYVAVSGGFNDGR